MYMNDRDSKWESYYLTLDPAERKKLLDEFAAEGNPADDFRRQLYRERYTDPRHPNETRDLWLFKCVYFPGLYGRRGFFPGSLKKEMQSAARELHLDHPEKLTEDEKMILYREFRNTASRYLMTCKGPNYGKTLFGLKKATEESRQKKLGHEFWVMTRGLAEYAGMEEEMDLWCSAFYDEMCEQEPDCREYYR